VFLDERLAFYVYRRRNWAYKLTVSDTDADYDADAEPDSDANAESDSDANAGADPDCDARARHQLQSRLAANDLLLGGERRRIRKRRRIDRFYSLTLHRHWQLNLRSF
jgi:hypothetical protein